VQRQIPLLSILILVAAPSWAAIQPSDLAKTSFEYRCVAAGISLAGINEFKLILNNDSAKIVESGNYADLMPSEGSIDFNYLPEKHSGYVSYEGFVGIANRIGSLATENSAKLEIEVDLLNGGYELLNRSRGGFSKLRLNKNSTQPYLCRLIS